MNTIDMTLSEEGDTNHKTSTETESLEDTPLFNMENSHGFDAVDMRAMLHEFNENTAIQDRDMPPESSHNVLSPSHTQDDMSDRDQPGLAKNFNQLEAVSHDGNVSKNDRHGWQISENAVDHSSMMLERFQRPNPMFFSDIDVQTPEHNTTFLHGTLRRKPGRPKKSGGKPAPNRVSKKRNSNARRTPNLLNMGSLVHNDIVASVRDNQGQGSQPKFTARNRKKALDELLSSIPKEQQRLHSNTRNHLDEACKKFRWKGQGSMHASADGQWLLKGMKTSLMHFQLLGCAWMRDQETGSKPPYGGIVADTMGLGKTITAICNMMEGRPKPEAKNQTTLIVVPSTLCKQWMDEMRKHCDQDVLGDVLVYRSGTRIEAMDICASLKRYSVIITTYSEVMKHYPNCDEAPAHITSDAKKEEWWEKVYEEERGPLLRIAFHRVILDEAQVIKNHKGRTSKACRKLHSKYRWILTGTPLSNCIEEFFSYFDFLGVEGCGSYHDFKQNFAKRDATSKNRLEAILRKVMIRRTVADKMFGKPIVSLPALSYKEVSICFGKVERGIYQIVEDRFREKIYVWKRKETLIKRVALIMVMLTRLRQMCAHVLFVSKCFPDILKSEDIQKIKRLVNQQSGEDFTGFQNSVVLNQVLQDATRPAPPGGHPVNETGYNDRESPSFGRSAPMSLNFRAYVRSLENEGDSAVIIARSLCQKCKDTPLPSRKRLSIPCGHMYCEECLSSMAVEATSQGTQISCLYCAKIITGQEEFKDTGDRQGPRYNMANIKREDSEELYIDENAWMDIPGTLMSSKTKAIVTQIEKWFSEHSDSKIIVFVQWLGMIEVLNRVCNMKGWPNCSLTGKMTQDARNKSIREFQNRTSDKRILLASLRCGGVGLNLTAARFVIIVDPWWNKAAEDQAFCRSFRIGQEHDVEVCKLVVEDTIETKLILLLQEKKEREIDGTLKERPDDEYDIDFLTRLFSPSPQIDGGSEFVIDDKQVIIDDSDEEPQMVARYRY